MTTNKPRDLEHPVWEVYGDYKTTVWNVKIQGAELKRLRAINYWIEIPLAILASASVTGLWFWSTPTGGHIWKVLGVITALIAVIKPFLKLPEEIQQRGEMLADYSSLEHDLEKLKKSISQSGKYDASLRRQYLKVLDRKGTIRNKYSGAKSLANSSKIKQRCKEEVDKRLPANLFYIPED